MKGWYLFNVLISSIFTPGSNVEILLIGKLAATRFRNSPNQSSEPQININETECEENPLENKT